MGWAGDGRFAGVTDGSTYQSVAAGDKGAAIIIDLADGVREHINKIPFHTSLLRWSLEDRRDPAAVYQELVPRVRDLMALLRGEDDD